jgi:hypothetical protein
MSEPHVPAPLRDGAGISIPATLESAPDAIVIPVAGLPAGTVITLTITVGGPPPPPAPPEPAPAAPPRYLGRRQE